MQEPSRLRVEICRWWIKKMPDRVKRMLVVLMVLYCGLIVVLTLQPVAALGRVSSILCVFREGRVSRASIGMTVWRLWLFSPRSVVGEAQGFAIETANLVASALREGPLGRRVAAAILLVACAIVDGVIVVLGAALCALGAFVAFQAFSYGCLIPVARRYARWSQARLKHRHAAAKEDLHYYKGLHHGEDI